MICVKSASVNSHLHFMYKKTPKQLSRICFLIILIWSVTLLYSCANIGTLSGGPEDKTPPVLKSHNLKDTGFRESTIVLEFDEFVKLSQPEKNIIFLPETGKKKFEIKGKKVLIHLEDKPAPSKTYQLLIRGGISDNNADNPFRGTFLFSTGSTVDSSFIGIRIQNASQFENLKVCINQGIPGDSFKSFDNAYALSADKDEDVVLYNGLKKSVFNIWVYTDKNGDKLPDMYIPLGFIADALTDSVYQISLTPWYRPFTVTKAKRSGPYMQLYYSVSPDYVKQIQNVLQNMNYQIMYGDSDSAIVYTQDTLTELTFPYDKVPAILYDKIITEATLRNTSLYKDDALYILKILLPPCYINLQESKTQVLLRNFNIKPDTIHLFNYVLQKTDTLNLRNINLLDYQTVSKMELILPEADQAGYDVKIYHEGKPLMILCGIHNYRDLLPAGNYKIVVFPANSIRKMNPEKMEITSIPLYEKTLYLKASWEEILDIKL